MLKNACILFLLLLSSYTTGYGKVFMWQDSIRKVEIKVSVRDKRLPFAEKDTLTGKPRNISLKKLRTSPGISIHKKPSAKWPDKPVLTTDSEHTTIQQPYANSFKNIKGAKPAPSSKLLYYLLISFLLIVAGSILGVFYRSSYILTSLAILAIVMAYYIIIFSLLFLN